MAPQETQGPALPEPIRYGLALDLRQPPEARVEATVELVAAPGVARDCLVFTLRRAFQVEAVRLNGTPVPFERERDLLRIRPAQPLPAGRPFTMTARYRGRVEDWRLDAHETPAALVGRELIYLPAGWGWYPVPGEQQLTWEIGMSSVVFRALADRTQPFNDAEPVFDVRVRARPGIRYLADFALEGDGTWRLRGNRNRLTLLGGPWWERVEGAVHYAVPFEGLDTWQASRAGLQRLLAAAADWTGIGPLSVVPSPVSLHDTGDFALLDAGPFGEVYEAGLTRERLAGGARQWVHDLLRFQPWWIVWNRPEDAARYAANEELDALRAYVISQVLGGEPGWQGMEPAGSYTQLSLVEAWAARTPLAAQKEAIRTVFRTAQRRPLAPADLAFLHEGEAR